MKDIKNTLENAGFVVTEAQGGLIVSLNRTVNTMEVKAALDFSEEVFYSRIDGKVFLMSAK